MNALHTLICNAIAARKLLMFAYGDAVRVVEPHLFGVTGAGNETLSAWLRQGLSRSDPEGWWRTYLVAEMRDVQMLDETFAGARPGYNANDERVAHVICQLPPADEPSGPRLVRDDPAS